MRRIEQTPQPRYLQARQYIERLIRSQALGPGDQLPSERDLARRLGFSQMTTNRAIQEMVREGLLYREVGRGTFIAHQDGHSRHVGKLALVSMFSPGGLRTDHYAAGVLRGVQAAAFDTEWDLLLIRHSLYEPEDMAARLRGRADGFLIMSPPDEALPGLRRMRAEGMPFLVAGSSWLEEDVPAIDTDNVIGAALAVRHLTDFGHRRIAMLGAPENMSNSRDRHIGFARALSEAGLPQRKDWFLPCACYWEIQEFEWQRLVQLVRQPDGPTAIVASGYMLAVNAMEILQSAGLRVPEDVSIVGFDDTFSAAHLNPPLTTVAQPVEAMGRRAVERLEALIGDAPVGEPVERLSTRLVVRQSAAPPSR